MLIRASRRSLKALWVLAICVVIASGAWLFIPAQHAKANDGGYPWAGATAVPSTGDWGYTKCPDNDTDCMNPSSTVEKGTDGNTYGVLDPYKYYLRYCTSFAAWKAASEGASVGGLGNAKSWATNAPSKGYTVNSTPAVGSVAQWNAYSWNGFSGHVAWVQTVNSDGSIVVEEYNFTYSGSWDSRTVTKKNVWPDNFIHFEGSGSTTPTPTPIPPPPPVPWSFENLEGGSGAVSPRVGNIGMTPATATFNGQLYIFYYDKTNKVLRVAYTHPGWVFDTVDGYGGGSGKVAGDVGQVPSTVVFNNVLYTFYYDNSNGNLRMAWTSDGTSWQTLTLDGDPGSLSGYNANVGQTPAVVVYQNSLQVFYYQPDQGVLRHAWSGNGSSWGFETLDGTSGSNSHFSGNVGLDASAVVYGNSLQVFYTNASQGDLRHAWSDANGWHFENLDGDAGSVGHSGDSVGGGPTAFVFQSNLSVLYYDQTQHNLRHAWNDANGWHFEVLLGTGSVIGYSSTDIGTSSTVVVNGTSLQSFVYEPGGGNLVHLWNDGSWHAENLDGAGGQPSSRIDANAGLDPAAIMFGSTLDVFYYDADHGALRHAWPN